MITHETDKYVIEEEGDNIVVTDKELLVVVRFTRHQFNDTQKVSLLEEDRVLKMDNPAQRIATCLREMADWLRANHYRLVF